MILNLIILVLVLLITAYLANQGFLSALLIFISATFASILAGGLFESLQGIVTGYRPDYARGITFLLLFFLGLSLCRLSADFAVPKNIKLPRIIDTAAGGIVAIFASLVIVGSILIGIEMLPLPTEILGYDRFGGDKRMQAFEDQGDQRLEKPGVVAQGTSPWFAPDSFTLGLWNLALGRSMGGDQPFAATHPDFLTELYGYRNTVAYGANETLPPDLLEVPAVTTTDNPEALKKFQITDPGKIAALVRTSVSLGADPKTSGNAGSKGENAGNYFYVTPSEVRLVTKNEAKGTYNQYYPVGYLDTGKTFVPLSLDTGQLAEDYSKDKAVDDWVFAINDDEKPQFLEVKALARKDVADILAKGTLPALAAGDYPPHKIQHDVATVQVKVTGPDGQPLPGVMVYILRQSGLKKDFDGPMAKAYGNLPSGDTLDDGSTEWGKNVGKPGVPDKGTLHNAGRLGLDLKNKAPGDDVFWRDLIPLLLAGTSEPNPGRNMIVLPDYFENTVVPLFSSTSQGTDIINKGPTDASGMVTLADIPKGSYTIVASYKGDTGFYVWATDFTIESLKPSVQTLSTNQTAFSITIPK